MTANSSTCFAAQVAAAMGRGITISNAFDSSYSDSRPVTLRPFLKAYREEGFQHVRLAVSWFRPDDSSASLVQQWSSILSDIDDAVGYAISLGLVVVLNSSAAVDLYRDYDGSAAYNDPFALLWKDVATHFLGVSPASLIFEVQTELQGVFNDVNMGLALSRQLNLVGYSAIRAVDSSRVIAVQPNGNGEMAALPSMYPTAADLPGGGQDGRLMISVQTFTPAGFCDPVSGSNSFFVSIGALHTELTDQLTALSNWYINVGATACCGLGVLSFGVGAAIPARRDSALVREYYRFLAASIVAKGWAACTYSNGNTFTMATQVHNTIVYPYYLCQAVLSKAYTVPVPAIKRKTAYIPSRFSRRR